MLPKYLIKPIDEIAHSVGFIDYKLESKIVSIVGENFFSIPIAVKITGDRNQNGKIVADSLHLFCKTSPTEITKTVHDIFIRETHLYSELLPKFMEFQREKGLSMSDSFHSYPKVYNCVANDETNTYFIIMEDLGWKNFKMYPKGENLPFDHQLMVVKELGKLHAISFAMKDQRPVEFEPFERLDDIYHGVHKTEDKKPRIERIIDNAINVLIDPSHRQILEEYRKTYEKSFDLWPDDESSKKFCVVGHGDNFSNNFLFKYSEHEAQCVESVQFLDWQLTRYRSPALDFLSFVWPTSDKSFRDKHYADLMTAYYTSFSETIQKLGSDPEKLFTFSDFQAELKNCGHFILIMSLMLIKVRLTTAPDIDKVFFEDFEDEKQQIYSKLVNDLLTDLVYYGYIQ